MLQRSTYTFALHTADEADCHLTRKVRIFGVVLKISPTQRSSLNVRPGTKNYINIQRDALLCQCFTQFADQIYIPSGRHAGSSWEAGSWDAFRNKVMYIFRASHTMRTICYGHFRYTQMLYRSCCPWPSPSAQCSLFFQSHFLDQICDGCHNTTFLIISTIFLLFRLNSMRV